MAKKIFIVGLSRAGTTFLYKMLMCLEEFASIKNEKKEKKVLFNFLNSDSRYSIHEPDLIRKMVGKIDEFYCDIYSNDEGSWIDASGNNFMYIEDILEYIPTAKILFIQRHPFEVIYSECQKNKYRIDKATLIASRARAWQEAAHMFKKYSGRAYNANVLPVRHEEIINDPVEKLKQCYEFLGLRKPDESRMMAQILEVVSRSSTGIGDIRLANIDEYKRYFSRAVREKAAGDLEVCCKAMDIAEAEINDFNYCKYELEHIDYDFESNIEKLGKNTAPIIFGTGTYAGRIVKLLETFSVRPGYFIDGSPKKRPWYGGLPVKNANLSVPGEALIIPASKSRKYEMVWQLIEQHGISKENILMGITNKIVCC